MLEVRNLDAWYDQSHILHGINLDIARGGRVAILGRNGAGKTTLLKSIMNAGPRVAGKVSWAGKPLGNMETYRRARLGLALVPEDRRIFGHITVRENIEMGGYSATVARPPIPADEILGRFPLLTSLGDRLGGQLSGGQQQVLAIARAIATRPDLLLLDEPTEGLAPVIVEQLVEDVGELCKREQISLLLSEQNVWFARACTDYLYIIVTGRIMFQGTWADFDQNKAEVQRHLGI